MNLREAWAKRRYPAHFVSKLTDCDGENSETDTSLDFALICGYVNHAQHKALTQTCQEIGRMLGAMINDPTPFLLPTSASPPRNAPK
ncbi:MAG: four helix bundle protein [Planctomycetaceae bacterium]|nr:four helix bundle protein [Planctomycetaceae bacterium]